MIDLCGKVCDRTPLSSPSQGDLVAAEKQEAEARRKAQVGTTASSLGQIQGALEC
jgi:hypothetical protein